MWDGKQFVQQHHQQVIFKRKHSEIGCFTFKRRDVEILASKILNCFFLLLPFRTHRYFFCVCVIITTKSRFFFFFINVIIARHHVNIIVLPRAIISILCSGFLPFSIVFQTFKFTHLINGKKSYRNKLIFLKCQCVLQTNQVYRSVTNKIAKKLSHTRKIF